jgi:hypothetical protein
MVPAQRCEEVAFARDGVADAEEDLGLAAAGETLHVHEDDATARRQGHGVVEDAAAAGDQGGKGASRGARPERRPGRRQEGAGRG